MSSMQLEFTSSMHTAAASSVDRAFINAGGARLRHGVVTNAHLLLGILAAGNEDATLPIPRLLREAGADHGQLYEFLEGNFELRSVNPGTDPELSRAARRTLARAKRIARRRAHIKAQRAVITADLLIAILCSPEPLLARALRAMGVDRAALLAKFPDALSKNRSQHLRAVN